MNRGCHGEITRLNGNILKTVKINCNTFDRIILYLKSLFCEYLPSKKANYIKSYRVEHSFYNNNSNKNIGILLPKIKNSQVNNFNLEYKLEMEDLSIYYSKDNYRNVDSMSKIIKEIAKFHIHFWNSKINYELWQLGGYWTGKKRQYDKDKFYMKFPIAKVNLLSFTNLQASDFEILQNYVHKNENSIAEYYNKKQTLIHGDLKLENLFLCEKGMFLIDYQWVGLGSCATDLMYLLFTSLSFEYLNIENIKILLNEYCRVQTKITFDELYNDFKIASIDFFKYLICCKWYNTTLENLQINDANKKDGFHVRKVQQIEMIFKVLLYFAQEF